MSAYRVSKIAKLPEQDRIEILKILATELPREKAFRLVNAKFPGISLRQAQDYCYSAIRRLIDSDLVEKLENEDPKKYIFLKKHPKAWLETLEKLENKSSNPSIKEEATIATEEESFLTDLDDSLICENSEKIIPEDKTLDQETVDNMSYLETLLICNYCDNIIEKPITLPCGNTICLNHTEDAFFKCKQCNKQHTKPPEGFSITKTIEKLLSSKIGEKLKLLKLSLNKLKTNVEELNNISQNSIDFINDYFMKLENQVKSERVKALTQINNEYVDLTNKINEERNKCEMAFKIGLSADELKNYYRKTEELEAKLKEFDDKNHDKLKEETERVSSLVQDSILIIKNTYLQNRIFSFVPNRTKEKIFWVIWSLRKYQVPKKENLIKFCIF